MATADVLVTAQDPEVQRRREPIVVLGEAIWTLTHSRRSSRPTASATPATTS